MQPVKKTLRELIKRLKERGLQDGEIIDLLLAILE